MVWFFMSFLLMQRSLQLQPNCHCSNIQANLSCSSLCLLLVSPPCASSVGCWCNLDWARFSPRCLAPGWLLIESPSVNNARVSDVKSVQCGCCARLMQRSECRTRFNHHPLDSHNKKTLALCGALGSGAALLRLLLRPRTSDAAGFNPAVSLSC